MLYVFIRLNTHYHIEIKYRSLDNMKHGTNQLPGAKKAR